MIHEITGMILRVFSLLTAFCKHLTAVTTPKLWLTDKQKQIKNIKLDLAMD